MAPINKPEHYINLSNMPQLNPAQPRSGTSTSSTSPVENAATAAPLRFPMGSTGSLASHGAGIPRLGSSSPSHEYGSRLFSKRAREIQAQEGVSHQVWCPPASGLSTPLRESIPESPDGEGFPDFNPAVAAAITSQPSSTPSSAGRSRTRAGTLPSRFSTASASSLSTPASLLTSKTSRPTPTQSPFQPGSSNPQTPSDVSTFPTLSAANKFNSLSSLSSLNRLRAGSMPQRPGYPSNPFGPSIFSSNWGSVRDRSSTLASIRSSDGPDSPAQSQFSRESLADTDVKTLDYLGLVDQPQSGRGYGQGDSMAFPSMGLQPAALAELLNRQNQNRFRSYSVNNKDRYDDEEDELAQGYYSGAMTPQDSTSAAEMAFQEAIRQHNLEVQAFDNLLNRVKSTNRPRARTAGVLETPSTRALRSFMPTASRLDSSMTASDLGDEGDYNGLAEAVQNLKLKGNLGHDVSLDESGSADSPTRALWLGNIPSSTTVSSLDMIFRSFGAIESTRVLTHKNCGFVNFENLESAVVARSKLNGKEIFPGAGPVRIGFAKVPSASATPGAPDVFSPPSPDPLAKYGANGSSSHANANSSSTTVATSAHDSTAALQTPELKDMKDDISEIVKELGATDEEQQRIAANVLQAIEGNAYEAEVPPVAEPTANRIHDAPRLRDIRKRIDNNSYSQEEIEEIAMGMLTEIAELSSDYLGNTVVQKLFEHCSESVKEAMLAEIGPHLAEIGCHKNGTWAAQKIIDVARSPELMHMVVKDLHQYSMALFLDQYGNYVMQGCLRYGSPLNDFIFDVMVARLWDLAQGRFGARAMRACLESHYASKDQQRMVAAAIAIHSVQLSTNANGALLLTWFLDTCTFPRRRSVLAPRLVPHLIHLCTHKVAYLTVLKIINQRNEPEARDVVLKALFFSENDNVLEAILRDQTCGATLIFKILTTPFFDEQIRSDVVQNIRNVLVRIKAQPQQGYKRLMDEVGLSTRSSGGGREVHRDERPSSKHSHANGPASHHSGSPMSQRAFAPTMQQGGYDTGMGGMQRSGSMASMDSFDQFPLSMNSVTSSPFGSAPGMPLPPPLTPAQIQYQQAMLAASARSGSFYPQNGMNGYSTAGAQMDPYGRNAAPPMASLNGGAHASMMMPPAQVGFPPQPAFNAPPQMYNYQMPYMNAPQQQQHHQQQQSMPVGAGRRGRVGHGQHHRY